TPPGKKTVKLDDIGSFLQVCDNHGCFQAPDFPAAELTVLDGDPAPLSAALQEAVAKATTPPPPPKPKNPVAPPRSSQDPAPVGPATLPGPAPAAAPEPPPAHAQKTAKDLDQYRQELGDIRARLDTSEVT